MSGHIAVLSDSVTRKKVVYKNRYDMMANGVDVTPERQETYEFSIPYAYNRTAVIVREDGTLSELSVQFFGSDISQGE